MAAIRRPEDLTDQDRRSLAGWIEQFARNWTAELLADQINQLRSTPKCPWRWLAVTEMVKLDLARQWRLGRQVSLTTYLEQYPELGDANAVPAELIWSELQARINAGLPVDLEAYARSYPTQASELLSLASEAGTPVAASTRKMRRRGTGIPTPAPSSAPKSPTTHVDPRTPRPSAHAPESSQKTQPQPLSPGLFGRYRIEKQLGQGGMGSVYKAYDTELDRHVALKVPQFSPHDGQEVLERFKQEARAAATLRHTNLCQVYDVGAIDETYYLTMEFIEGRSLESYVAQQQNASPRFIALVMKKLARALKTAHAKNVIHRDLKPSNIMMRDADGTMEPVIVDFGLARRIEPGTARLTQSGLVIGTWQYMTPEQLCGEPNALGPGCDIYALGVIMYELLTGRLPFEAPGQVVRGNPAPPSSCRPDVDPRLEAICLKAMAATSTARYASMGDLASALTDYLRSSSERAPETRVVSGPESSVPQATDTNGLKLPHQSDGSRPGTTRMKIAGAAAVALVLGSCGFWAFWSRTARGPSGEAPSVSDRQGVSKTTSPALASPTIEKSEPLFDSTWQAIRLGQLGLARTTLQRYLDLPQSSKKEEARALLADLDHATSQTEARNRARGLGNEELKKRIDQGVKDMLEVIRTPELRDAYAALLLDEIRREDAARLARLAAVTTGPSLSKSSGAASAVPAGNAAPSRATSATSLPRAASSARTPVRGLEPNFRLLYNGQNFDGWESSVWRVATPAKGRAGFANFAKCAPSIVVHKEGLGLASYPVDGNLRTERLFQLASFKFDYMISPLVQGSQAKAKKGALGKSGRTANSLPIRPPHISATLYLDQPSKIGNTAQCTSITFYLAPINIGRLMTLGHGSSQDESFYDPSSEERRPRGQWNDVEIRCGEKEIVFLLNGVPVNRLEASRRITSHVGFSFDGQEVHLANIRLAEGKR